jgi:prepilin-type processing-associated H-X9-DG protein
MVSEKWVRSDRYTSGDWMDDQGWLCGWDPDIVRMTAFPPIQDTNQAVIWNANAGGEWQQGFGFGSAHTSTMNALFGDGSVRPVKYSVNPIVWWRLGNRRDGQVINMSDL